MRLKIIPIYVHISEKEFPNYIWGEESYYCLRFTHRNFKEIEKHIPSNIDLKEIATPGKPDFFIWKNKQWFFIEFKSERDVLFNAQMRWMYMHQKLNIGIAIIMKPGEVYETSRSYTKREWNSFFKKNYPNMDKPFPQLRR